MLRSVEEALCVQRRRAARGGVAAATGAACCGGGAGGADTDLGRKWLHALATLWKHIVTSTRHTVSLRLQAQRA
jgi:hypothetical protein